MKNFIQKVFSVFRKGISWLLVQVLALGCGGISAWLVLSLWMYLEGFDNDSVTWVVKGGGPRVGEGALWLNIFLCLTPIVGFGVFSMVNSMFGYNMMGSSKKEDKNK